MLPTFVIGLREGLEAALIVGIIAAFLRRQGRRDLLVQVWLGVGTAVLGCVAVGVGLDLFSRALPQRQQEGLETVIGVLAVGMVTYMVVWMKEHSRGLRSDLEHLAAGALDARGRAGTAMVAMAFLAVLREGFETAVFLLAAINGAEDGASPLIGLLLGIAVAVVLGYGIYRGGVRLNLSRFFRATGLVLVLVAGGLVVSALHTAHEAGWLDLGQQRMLDLSWFVQPGSVHSSVLTGILGIQPFPVLVEVLGWLLYVVPVGVFVAWPPGRPVPWRRLGGGLVGAGAVALIATTVVALTLPSASAAQGAADAGAALVAGPIRGDRATVRMPRHDPFTGELGPERSLVLRSSGTADFGDGLTGETFTAEEQVRSRRTTLSVHRIAELNGGRLPIGLRPSGDRVRVTEVDTVRTTATIDRASGTVVDVAVDGVRSVHVATTDGADVALSTPARAASWALPAATAAAAADQATAAHATHDDRRHRTAVAWLLGGLGGPALLAGLLILLRASGRRVPADQVSEITVGSAPS